MAGAMLRPAIEPTLTEFEAREGCRVERIYNGCGILVSQMNAAGPGDLFFSCDASFMTQMAQEFPDATDVSSNRLVILVQEGNPHGIRGLEDLGKPGLKVGIGHEKQCALGVITQTTLTQTGTLKAVSANVVVQVPAGDMLVNQMLAGGLDAAVTYVSNAAGHGDKLDAIAVDVPCATASQPLGIARSSRFPQLAARLRDSLRSETSRRRFEAMGFEWK
jgi:ABC-type molybdate transport system substrate-binding protein